MYLQDALSALLRRWLVVLLGLVAVVAASYLTTRDVPRQYQSSGQLLVMLPPDATGPENPTSPYLNAPAGLTTAASLVATEASMLDTQRRLAAEGYRADYTVSVFPGAGPLVVVTAKGTEPSGVVATRDAVMALVTEELRQMQQTSGAPPNQRMYVRQSSVDLGAEPMGGSKKRFLIGITGAVGVATLLLCALLERARLAVRRRRAVPATTPPPTGTGADRSGVEPVTVPG